MYQSETFKKMLRLPAGSAARRKAMQAAIAELKREGCVHRRTGDNLMGWGMFWIDNEDRRLHPSPGCDAISAVLLLRLRKITDRNEL